MNSLYHNSDVFFILILLLSIFQRLKYRTKHLNIQHATLPTNFWWFFLRNPEPITMTANLMMTYRRTSTLKLDEIWFSCRYKLRYTLFWQKTRWKMLKPKSVQFKRIIIYHHTASRWRFGERDFFTHQEFFSLSLTFLFASPSIKICYIRSKASIYSCPITFNVASVKINMPTMWHVRATPFRRKMNGIRILCVCVVFSIHYCQNNKSNRTKQVQIIFCPCLFLLRFVLFFFCSSKLL